MFPDRDSVTMERVGVKQLIHNSLFKQNKLGLVTLTHKGG